MRRWIVSATLLLASCARYAPAPLATAPDLARAPETRAPAATLSVDDVVRLALRDNPDLRAARARRGVAEAQLLQAGILPNPSLAGSFMPLVSGVGVAPAWGVSLAQDVKALMLRPSLVRGGRDAAGQVAADLLWQEWQVAGQARQLAVDLIGVRRQLPFARRGYAILSQRNDAMARALANRDVTLVLAAPSLGAVQTARVALYGVEQRELQLRHQLAALLGLVPDAPIVLDDAVPPPAIDPVAVRAGLSTLPDRRPDLLALRLGYAEQDETFRQAIIAQFPDLVLGPGATSDSSKVVNVGPEATIGLPIFDRNQGGVAIARATREQLRREYLARLDAVTGEVGAALTEVAQLRAQLDVAVHDLSRARAAAAQAEAARTQSAIDEAAFVDLISTRYAKELDVLALRFALLDRQVALQTLLGVGLPQVDTLAMREAAAR